MSATVNVAASGNICAMHDEIFGKARNWHFIFLSFGIVVIHTVVLISNRNMHGSDVILIV